MAHIWHTDHKVITHADGRWNIEMADGKHSDDTNAQLAHSLRIAVCADGGACSHTFLTQFPCVKAQHVSPALRTQPLPASGLSLAVMAAAAYPCRRNWTCWNSRKKTPGQCNNNNCRSIELIVHNDTDDTDVCAFCWTAYCTSRNHHACLCPATVDALSKAHKDRLHYQQGMLLLPPEFQK